jgi:hypothetical protein
MLSQFFENPAQMLFLGGVSLATWLLMRRLYIRRRKDSKRVDPIKEITKKERPVQSVDAPAESLRWEVRIHDIGREISARIDSKLSALQALTKMAHEAAERLEIAAMHAAELESKHYGSSPLDAIEQRIHEVTFEVGTAVELSAKEPKPLTVDPVESLRRVVKRLLINGQTAEEISAQTSMPLGEVEFLASTLTIEKPRAA